MANTTFLSKLKSLSLLVLLLLLQASILTASPTTPPALASISKRAGQFPKFSNDYAGRVKKGAYLRSLMPLDNKKAALANGGASVASPYQDPNAIARWGQTAVTQRWGWTLETSWFPFANRIKPYPDDKALENAFKDPAFPVNWRQSGVYSYYHNKGFTQANGKKGEPTMAAYKNIVNPSAGALIFADNTSPEHSIRQYRLRGAAVPDLHQLSDFAFFEWVKGCQYKKANPRDLKVVFRTHIVYAPTFALVAAALMDAGYKRIPTWENRATIKMGTRPGDAILGSTHGSGTALMLIQHKDVLGVKEIVEAVVWGSGAGGDKDGFDFKAQPRQVDLNIRFTIRNA